MFVTGKSTPRDRGDSPLPPVPSVLSGEARAEDVRAEDELPVIVRFIGLIGIVGESGLR